MTTRASFVVMFASASTLLVACAAGDSPAGDDAAESAAAYSEPGPYGPQLACPAGDVSGFASIFPSGLDYATRLRGGLYVRKTAYRKRVGVLMSTDDFRGPPTVIDARYVHDGYLSGGLTFDCGPEFELWEVPDQQIAPANSYWQAKISLAFFYDNLESGQTSWDSKFGRNYVLTGGSPDTGSDM